MKSKRTNPNQENINVRRVATIVGLILLIPLMGNIYVEGWRWGFFDFVVMGTLLFGTGLAIEYAIKKFKNPVYKVLACLTIVLVLLLVWVELAVDAVSQFVTKFF